MAFHAYHWIHCIILHTIGYVIKSYDDHEIEAGMTKIGSFSEVFKATLHCLFTGARQTYAQFIVWHDRRASRLYRAYGLLLQ